MSNRIESSPKMTLRNISPNPIEAIFSLFSDQWRCVQFDSKSSTRAEPETIVFLLSSLM